MKQLLFLTLSALAGAAWCNDLKPFEFNRPQTSEPPQSCSLGNLKLPVGFEVFAAGAYAGREIGFQIDQSGHEATQIDVAVNSPKKPVVLMLGAYEPTIWNIGWTPGTQIVAVLASGYHRQAVAGLPANTPLINSSHHNKGPCGYFYVGDKELAGLNPMARRVFGRAVDMVYPAQAGRVVIGEALPAQVKLVTSSQTTPDSFRDRSAPIAGPAGLQDAVRKGWLRPATQADARAFAEAVAKSAPARDVPPVAGGAAMRTANYAVSDAFVVLKAFTFPAGLYGAHSATFYIPKGVVRPTGNPGHSTIHDFNTLGCQDSGCKDR